MSVLHVDKASFEAEVLQAAVPVLVDFWAPWCGPCKMLGPVLEEVAAQVGEKAKIVKVNVDENPELAARFSVMSIPSLFVIKAGETVGNSVGFQTKDQLITLLGL